MKDIMIWICLVVGVAHAESASLPSESVYHLNSTWRDQNGKEVKLAEFTGRPVLLTMVYTSCPHACPMTIAKIQEVERALIKAGQKNYKLVLASFDIRRDTPSQLKKYMKGRKLSEEQWVLLSASSDAQARELAAVLGISYKQLSDGEFSHSNIITYLNEQGVAKGKIEGLNAKIDPLLLAMGVVKE